MLLAPRPIPTSRGTNENGSSRSHSAVEFGTVGEAAGVVEGYGIAAFWLSVGTGSNFFIVVLTTRS
jgi:hypothetical protein